MTRRTFPRRRHLLRWTAVGAVVIASACSDAGDGENGGAGEGAQELTSRTAAEALDNIIDDVMFSDDPDQLIYEELTDCTIDPGGVLLAQALGDIDAPDIVSASGEALSAGIDRYAADEPAMLVCDRFGEGDAGSGIGIFASAAPTSIERYAEVFAARASDADTVQIEYTASAEFDEGQFHRVCAQDPDDDEFGSYCEVEWADDHVMIGIYVSGPNSIDIDLDAMEAGLRDIVREAITKISAAA